MSCIIELEVSILGIEVDILRRVEIVKFRSRTVCKRNPLKGDIQVGGRGIIKKSESTLWITGGILVVAFI